MNQRRVKIFGPPGTGKTETLLRAIQTYRDETGCPSENVGLVTFTRSGREEALARLGGGEAAWPLVRTLHSLCYRGLSMSQGRMVQRSDLQRFAELVGVEISGEGQNLDDETAPTEIPVGDQLLRLNHLGRHRKLRLREAMAAIKIDADERLAEHFTKAYRAWKDQEGILDYTDLLTRYVARGEALPAQLFIVDEAQDLSPLQWDVVERMSKRAQTVMAAGDDDQAIYSWAGATADLFNGWEAHDTRVLSQSYRLPRVIHSCVESISHKIEQRQAKVYAPRSALGEVLFTGELPDMTKETALVLYRYGHRGKQLAKEMREQGTCFGGVFSPLSKKDTRLALEYLNGSREKEAVQAAVGLSGMPEPKAISDLRRAWYLDYLVRVGEEVGLHGMLNPRVTLSSIHASKGRQAEAVVLDTSMSRASYEHLQLEPDDENRVWYVGASRASETLVVLESSSGKYSYEI